MTKTAVSEQITHRWYTRPVLFVADVNRALRFYIDMLASRSVGMRATARAGSAKSIARDARSSFARMPREETRRACSWH